MNKRFVAILAALLLILGGTALYVHQREDTAQPAVSAQLGQPLLKDLKASDIATIALRDANRTDALGYVRAIAAGRAQRRTNNQSHARTRRDADG